MRWRESTIFNTTHNTIFAPCDGHFSSYVLFSARLRHKNSHKFSKLLLPLSWLSFFFIFYFFFFFCYFVLCVRSQTIHSDLLFGVAFFYVSSKKKRNNHNFSASSRMFWAQSEYKKTKFLVCLLCWWKSLISFLNVVKIEKRRKLPTNIKSADSFLFCFPCLLLFSF